MFKFSCFFGATTLIKLKLELHERGGLLIANHLDQLDRPIKNTETQSRPIYYTRF